MKVRYKNGYEGHASEKVAAILAKKGEAVIINDKTEAKADAEAKAKADAEKADAEKATP
jgi:hypothetical protein